MVFQGDVIWDFHVRDDRHHADAKVTLYDIFAESQPVTVLLNDDKGLTLTKIKRMMRPFVS
jgi:hypothetical protein